MKLMLIFQGFQYRCYDWQYYRRVRSMERATDDNVFRDPYKPKGGPIKFSREIEAFREKDLTKFKKNPPNSTSGKDFKKYEQDSTSGSFPASNTGKTTEHIEQSQAQLYDKSGMGHAAMNFLEYLKSAGYTLIVDFSCLSCMLCCIVLLGLFSTSLNRGYFQVQEDLFGKWSERIMAIFMVIGLVVFFVGSAWWYSVCLLVFIVFLVILIVLNCEVGESPMKDILKNFWDFVKKCLEIILVYLVKAYKKCSRK